MTEAAAPHAPHREVRPQPSLNGRAALFPIPAIDGLRGIAALSVAMFHFIRIQPTHSPFFSHLEAITSLGWSGVDLFFVLSGFLITRILLNTKSNAYYFRNFYIRRTLRIFPLYYAIILTIFVILPLEGSYPAGADQKYWPFFFTYTSNVMNIIGLGGGPIYTTHFWTLAIEEQFYFVWPLVIYTCSTKVLSVLLPLLLTLGVLLRWILVSEWNLSSSIRLIPFAHADGLLLGGAIAFMLFRGWKITFPGVMIQIATMALGIFFLYGLSSSLFGLAPYPEWWGGFEGAILLFIISLIYTMFLLFAIGPSNIFQIFFTLAPLRWLGKYSYAIYALHVPIMILVARIPIVTILQRFGIGAHITADLLYLALMLTLTLAAALISWNALEKPMLRLKRLVPYESNTRT